MPDLNSLLRWSIANSASQNPEAAESDPNDDADPSTPPLSLRFRPASANSNATQPTAAALHPSDPYYRRPITPQGIIDDISPASTPGPTTPQPGETVLPNGGTGVIGQPRSDLTTEMLDLIMGKSDSMVMKEKMDIACDESRDIEERVEALDDFEMLIEMIDNANNMAILKLWEPIRDLLSSSHQEIIRHAAWICGTAVQNNLKAQAALYMNNIFPIILSLIYPDPSQSLEEITQTTSTRAKATYALSSALKHWPLASLALSIDNNKGYHTLLQGVSDSESVVRRKMAFLIGTLVAQSNEEYTGEIPGEVRALIEESSASGNKNGNLVDGLKDAGVFARMLAQIRDGDESDVEFEENCMRALVAAFEKGGLENGEKQDLAGVWGKWGDDGREARGLGGEDGVQISKVLRG